MLIKIFLSRQELARNTIKKIGNLCLSKTSDFHFVIRLGFAKVLYFTLKSGALSVDLLHCKALIYNIINMFIVVWVTSKTIAFA